MFNPLEGKKHWGVARGRGDADEEMGGGRPRQRWGQSRQWGAWPWPCLGQARYRGDGQGHEGDDLNLEGVAVFFLASALERLSFELTPFILNSYFVLT